MIISSTYLLRSIVDMAIFLEFTSSNLLDEDAAVEAMAQLAAELQKIPQSELAHVSRIIVSLASAYASPKKEFVEGLPEALGLS